MSAKPMSPERERSLRRLAEMMNTRHRNPFPITRPLLDCFDIALAPEDVDLLLKIGPRPFSPAEAAARCGVPEDAFRPAFDRLMKKGFIWPDISPGAAGRYSVPGIMLGWFEVFLSDGGETPEQREFARRLDLLFKSWGKMNFFPLRSFLNARARKARPQQSVVAAGAAAARPDQRTIAVDRVVPTPAMKIYPARTVQELIRRQDDSQSIVLVHCFCRQYHKMIDEPCRFEIPGPSCMAIGALARHAAESGSGRMISRDEAISLVGELEKKGVVHQVFHEDEDAEKPEIAICNCCWDCCGVFGSYNRGIIPLNLKCYYEAQVPDASICRGCSTCADYCPVGAIAIADDKSRIDARKCIGCGQCELQCPENAICLVPRERTVMLPLVKRSEARIAW